jgi:DNA-binding PadR family transcriptional regulator
MVWAMAVRRSNPLALAILVYLGERPRHPYEIAADMRLRHQHESIKLNYGSLYGVIATLERQKLIEAQETIRDGKRPERTIYTITEHGQRECVDWLSELLSAPAKEFTGFEAALSLLGALPPDEVAALLRRRVHALDQQIAQHATMMHNRVPADLPRLFVLEAEYSQELAEAERRFVAALVEEIEQGTLEGVDAWRQWSEGSSPWTKSPKPVTR